jgi:predicted permease
VIRLRAFLFRLWGLVRHRQVDREIEDEISSHLAEATEEYVQRGLSPEDAHWAAMRSFGSVTQTKEVYRQVQSFVWLDDCRQDVRHAWRLLWRNPALTMVVVLTLAVAIGATVTAFSVTDAWLFRSLRFPNADRLVVAFAATATRPSEPAVWMPYRAYLAFKDSARLFSSMTAAAFQQVTWRTSSDAKSVVGMRVTPEFFSTFGVPPLHGRPLAASDANGPPVLVLSNGFWQRELGGADGVLGTILTLSDIPYTVVGVMPSDFDVRLLDQPEGAAFWTLLRTGERGYEPGGIGPVAIVGRIKDGVTIDAAGAEVAALMRRAESAYPRNFNELYVANLSSLQADNTRTVRATLLTVLASTVCVLLIASMNIGALLLGRERGRRGEVAVRHVLGAARGRLIRQFLAEALLLSVCGGALGVGLAAVGTRLFLAWNPLGTLPANNVRLELRTLAVATLAMAITTIVAGLVPAVRTSAAPAAALRGGEGGRAMAPTQRAQRGMLVAQMAVSTVLLVCAALLAKTFVQLRTEPLGFVSNDLTVATVVLPMTPFPSGTARYTFYSEFEKQLLARPGVRAVAAGTSPPLEGGVPTTVNLTAVDSVSAPRMSTQDVTPGFFEALGVSLIDGRTFDRRDSAQAAPVLILNARAAADLFGDPRRAVGQRVRLDSEAWRDIVGVVGNVRTTFFNTLEWRTEPIVYRPAAQAFSRIAPMGTAFTLWVHIRAERLLTATEVREVALAVNPRAAVIELQRVPALVAAATRQPTLRVTLLLWFCVVSLLLAAIGVSGVVTQAVIERRREIAIRIALGAHPRVVVATFVRKALGAGIAGLVIGVALAMILARSLESMLYGGRTSDAASITVAAVLLLAVISVAAWVPALRATQVDPVKLLRA